MSGRRGPGLAPLLGFVALVVMLAVPSSGADAGFSTPTEISPTALQERRLVQGLLDLRGGRLEDALRNVTRLVRAQPDFGLAQLVYGDLLLASTGQLPNLGLRMADDSLADYRHEARVRLYRYLAAPPVDAVPDSVLRLPDGAPAAIVVDLEGNRLYLLEQRGEELERSRDFYVSIGKGGMDKQREGDDKTPIGVYRVSSFLPGRTLPDMYGVGAYPLTYPNAWDRLHGRTGSGIWIHGTESARYSRPPLSSEGCVTLANDDFRALMERVEVEKTAVVVADKLRWVAKDLAVRGRNEIESAVESWRRDWESLDTERYLANYAADFKSGGMGRAAFATHKRRVNSRKSFIRVELDDLGIFRYPGETDLVVVSFLQRYRSSNFSAEARKQQYWRREDGVWRIVLEASA